MDVGGAGGSGCLEARGRRTLGYLVMGDADGAAEDVHDASQAATGEEEGARGTTDGASGEALLLELPGVGVHDVPPIREYVGGH